MQKSEVQRTAAGSDYWRRLPDLLGQRLFINAFFLWANAAVGALGGFAFWILAARLYTTADVGLAAATLSAVTLLGTVSHLGLGMGLVRYLPGAERRQDLINLAVTIAALVGVGASFVFLFGLPVWSPGLSYLPDNALYSLGFVLFAAATTAATIPMMAFVALRRAGPVLAIGVLGQLLRIALPVLFVSQGAFGIVASGGVAAVMSLALGLLLLSMVQKPYRPGPALNLSSAAVLVPFGMVNHLADLALLAPSLILPLMVVNALGADSGAHFYVGFFLGGLVLMGLQGLSTSLFAEGSHDAGSLERSARHTLAGALVVSVAGAAAMLVAGDKLLLAFGAAYSREATGLLRLLALAAVPASLTYVYLAVQRVRGRIASLLTVSGLVCASSLGLSYFLLPGVGIAGPGIGVLAGQCLGALLCGVDLARGGWRAKSRPAAAVNASPANAGGTDLVPPNGPAPTAVFPAINGNGHRPTVTMLMCTLNEESSLPHVLAQVPAWVDEVLLVDGRSTDRTVEIAERMLPGLRVVYQPGSGKGDALRFGVREATGDVVVTVDADGETDPSQAMSFVEALEQGYDFAKGSRLASGKPRRMPLYRWLGNQILAQTFNLLFATRFTDICSGYNAFRRQAFLRLPLTYDNCEMEQQMLARARKSGMKIVEVSHRSEGRIAGVSKVSALKQGFIDWLVVVKERFRG